MLETRTLVEVFESHKGKGSEGVSSSNQDTRFISRMAQERYTLELSTRDVHLGEWLIPEFLFNQEFLDQEIFLDHKKWEKFLSMKEPVYLVLVKEFNTIVGKKRDKYLL